MSSFILLKKMRVLLKGKIIFQNLKHKIKKLSNLKCLLSTKYYLQNISLHRCILKILKSKQPFNWLNLQQ